MGHSLISWVDRCCVCAIGNKARKELALVAYANMTKAIMSMKCNDTWVFESFSSFRAT